MRVVSGLCKGRQLKAVPGNKTRPTTDKVKESLFNMIGPYFSGGIGLDLFAGSGSLGIEALSRGLDKVIFVERNFKAVQVVKENLANCQLTEVAEVYRTEAHKALKALIKREMVFDYIFLDPPYEKDLLKGIIEVINEGNLLSSEGIIVCEHESHVQLANQVGELIKNREERYGLAMITIYSRK